MADPVTYIPPATVAWNNANPNATVADQVAASKTGYATTGVQATVAPPKVTPPVPTPPVTPTPPTTPAPTTAISSDQGAQYASENSQTLQTLKNTGLTVGPDGLARYSDSSFASAPSDAVQTEDGTWQSGGVKYAMGPGTAVNPEQQKINDTITSMKAQFDDTSRAMIDGIKAQYDQLIAQQTDVNTRSEASLGQTLLMGGSERYAPVSSGGQVTAMMSYGLSQISDLQNKENAAILQAQQAQDSGDMKFMDEMLTQAQSARDAKQKAAQTLSDSLVKANNDLQTQKKAAALGQSVADLMAEGVTDPAKILKSLQDAGNTTASATDVGNAIKALTPPASSGNFKFSQTQASQMYAAGLTPEDVSALQEYYSGNGDPNLFSSLTPEHQTAVLDALNGTAAKKAASQVPSYAQLNPKGSGNRGSSSYTSGSLSYSADTVGQIQSKILETKGNDGYVDPYVYQKYLDAWTQDGGLAKDFIKNFPVKNYINPAATWMPAYIASKTSGSTSSGAAPANPFQ